MTATGDYIRAVRLDAKLSLRAVAAKMGISHVFLGEIERSKRPLPLDQIENLLGALVCASRGALYGSLAQDRPEIAAIIVYASGGRVRPTTSF